MLLIRVALFAVLLGFGNFAAASVHSAPVDRAISPLLALSNSDEESTTETGCTSTFYVGRRDYLQLVGTEVMLRDMHGLHACRLTKAGTQALETGKANVACSQYRLQVRTVGQATTNAASDSSSTNAVLTIDRRGVVATMRGRWGVAC
ncbi:hypothetical protein SAMN05192583_3516 [Sphingomonas gellani]|uniref:Uncharacterized protein n=1 Tax=Sphingomonas gellani TaxID=1166340 RepID=A0A1H8J6Y9_9SPHN|nr:hypothetical protein [Sphingomonas gellani]SEN76703.1 hypothetical protein SAMN05192583_3516 [Sphingomonas gellani]